MQTNLYSKSQRLSPKNVENCIKIENSQFEAANFILFTETINDVQGFSFRKTVKIIFLLRLIKLRFQNCLSQFKMIKCNLFLISL